MFIEDNDWNDEQASQALRKPLLNKAVENGTIKFKVDPCGPHLYLYIWWWWWRRRLCMMYET